MSLLKDNGPKKLSNIAKLKSLSLSSPSHLDLVDALCHPFLSATISLFLLQIWLERLHLLVPRTMVQTVLLQAAHTGMASDGKCRGPYQQRCMCPGPVSVMAHTLPGTAGGPHAPVVVSTLPIPLPFPAAPAHARSRRLWTCLQPDCLHRTCLAGVRHNACKTT